MPRKKVIKRPESFDKIKDSFEEEKNKANEVVSVDLVKHAGGSINNLPVKTKAFGSWLEAHRSTNPFIGKHVTAAPEEFTEEVKLDDEEVLDDASAAAILAQASAGAGEFDPNSTFGEQAEDLGESLRDDGNHEKKFIDLTIAENTTRKYLALPEHKIEEEAKRAMKAYHDDNDYEPEINVSAIVEESKVLFLEQKKEEKEKREQLKIARMKDNNSL